VAYFSGDEDNRWCSAVMNDNYIFSNDIDGIYYWDMSASFISKLPGCENYACRDILPFGSRLCLYNTKESAVRYAQRVRWSAATKPGTSPVATDWTATGSGASDLLTVFGEDAIVRALPLGNFVVIYSDHNITVQDYKTDVDEPFEFYLRVPSTGLLARDAVVNLGDGHVLLGRDDVYYYAGGRTVDRIASPNVKDELFSIIDPQYAGRSFMKYIKPLNEIRIYIPTTGSTTPNKYFTFNTRSKAWYKGTRSYTGTGEFEEQSETVINSLTGTINSYVGRIINDRVTHNITPITMFGNSSGVVYKDVENVWSLAGDTIDSYWETKDFVATEGYLRRLTNWMGLGFEARGNTVTVYASTDSGVSWPNSKVFTLSDTWSWERWNFNVNAEKIRYRFRNNKLNSSFQLRNIQIAYIPASDRGLG